MTYDTYLADRIREYLVESPKLKTEEKLKIKETKMFRGLTFMVNGKMCIGVSGENLMCRFNPALQNNIAGKKGFQPMIMKGKELKGYCYINPDGVKSRSDFEYWINLCLAFNSEAKSSKR